MRIVTAGALLFLGACAFRPAGEDEGADGAHEDPRAMAATSAATGKR